MFTRRLTLPQPGARTFFLWGPRQVGKTTLLRQCYPDAFWVDLLKADEFRRYATRPESLRLALRAEGPDPARQDHPGVGRRIVVCLEPQPLRTDDGIEILPVDDFLDQLWSGALLG